MTTTTIGFEVIETTTTAGATTTVIAETVEIHGGPHDGKLQTITRWATDGVVTFAERTAPA